MMARLRWILGYTRLEIWRKIGLSVQTYVFAQLAGQVSAMSAF